MNFRIVESEYGLFKNLSPGMVISFLAAAVLTGSTLLIPYNPFAIPGLLLAPVFLSYVGQSAANKNLLAYAGMASFINILFYTLLFYAFGWMGSKLRSSAIIEKT